MALLLDSRRRHVRSAILATVVAVLVLVGLTAPAQAAPGTVSTVAVSVAQDGSEPLVPAYDDDLHNLLVASNDQIRWTVSGTVTLAGDVTYTSTLPAGMQWDATSIAATICNVSGSVSTDRRTWTCTRAAETGTESFQISARVGAVANGAVIAPTVTADAASGTAPGVTVVGESRTELRIYTEGLNQAVTHEGQPGAIFQLSVHIGATLPDGNARGLQAFESPRTFRISVPPHAVVASYSLSALPGVMSISQAAPGEDVYVTATGMVNDFLTLSSSAAVPADYRTIGPTMRFAIFTPNDPTLPPGVITPITAQVKGFDPVGLDGSSNFGTGYAPGQDPTYTCPGTTGQLSGSQLSCARWSVNRIGGLLIRGNNAGATVTPTSGNFLLGDAHGYTQGQEKIVPGMTFGAHLGFGNLSSASESATQPRGCVVFDNNLLTVTGPAVPKRAGNPITAVYAASGTALTAGNYVLEYSAATFASDDERRAVDCGTAGDGAPGWVTDPATLPGGLASVTSIRVLAGGLVLDPAVSLGLSVPFARTLTPASLALPVDAAIPWFFQYGTAETPLVKSAFPSAGTGTTARTDGGYVQAVPTLVRATAAFARSSVDPGTATVLQVNPFLVGPVGTGVTTRAEDVSVTVTMDSTCLAPVPASLEALVAAGKIQSYTVTPADPGADGIACTGDDGAPAVVVLHLGGFDAPAGPANLTAVGFTNNKGHQINLDGIGIGVFASPLTPSGTTHTPKLVVAATTDSSWEFLSAGNLTDRTAFPALVVTGVAAFSGSKSAATATIGELSPGEVFSYTMAWGNGTGDESGPGTFVDLLPYDGDARGTTGLGTGGLELSGVTAEMANPALMGDVTVQYTTDAPASVATALAQVGNEDGATGITWQSGAVPVRGVSAVRFVMSDDLRPGYTGSATLTARAPGLQVDGRLVNDLYGRTAPVNGDPATVKSFRAIAAVELVSNAAELGGTIFRDLDFSGTVTDGDDTWAPTVGIVEIVDEATGTVVTTTDVTADGAFRAPVAPGTYLVRLAAGSHDGWTQVDPVSRTVGTGDVVDDFDQLYSGLFAEDDTAETLQDQPVDVPVLDNDSGRDIAITATTPSLFGTTEINPDGTVRFTPSAGFSGLATFQYTVTDALGATTTATVGVTVWGPPLPAAMESTTRVDVPVSTPAWSFDPAVTALAADDGFRRPATTVAVADGEHGTATLEDDGTLRYVPEAGFVGDDQVVYTVRDDRGQEATAVWTIHVLPEAVDPPTTEPPTTEPPTTDPATPTDGEGTGTAPAGGGTSSGGDRTGWLASTGASSLALALAAMVAIGVGAAAVARRRRIE